MQRLKLACAEDREQHADRGEHAAEESRGVQGVEDFGDTLDTEAVKESR
jgi:hypothetical protein